MPYGATSAPNAPAGTNLSTYYDTNTLTGTIGYELDLWGEIRNEVAAGNANAAAAPPRSSARRFSNDLSDLGIFLHLHWAKLPR